MGERPSSSGDGSSIWREFGLRSADQGRRRTGALSKKLSVYDAARECLTSVRTHLDELLLVKVDSENEDLEDLLALT